MVGRRVDVKYWSLKGVWDYISSGFFLNLNFFYLIFLDLLLISKIIFDFYTITAASRFTSRRKKVQETGDLKRLPPLFTFLPTVRIPVTCKRRKIHKPVDFNFSFFFRSVLVFSFLDLFHCRSIFSFFFFSIPGSRQQGGGTNERGVSLLEEWGVTTWWLVQSKPARTDRSLTPPSSLVGGKASRGIRRGNRPH